MTLAQEQAYVRHLGPRVFESCATLEEIHLEGRKRTAERSGKVTREAGSVLCRQRDGDVDVQKEDLMWRPVKERERPFSW